MGQVSGTTLHTTEFAHVAERTIIGDSRFGSVNAAMALQKHWLYFIEGVNNGYYGFPKAHMKE